MAGAPAPPPACPATVCGLMLRVIMAGHGPLHASQLLCVLSQEIQGGGRGQMQTLRCVVMTDKLGRNGPE